MNSNSFPSQKITPNPYDVLKVSPNASNAEITKAFTLAMKRKEYPLDVIAKARKSLTNSQERLIADYLRPILPTIQPFQQEDFSELETPAPKLELLPELNDLDAEIQACKTVSDFDKQLGESLF